MLGRGDFVFIAAKGSHESAPCLYIDLYRVEDGKIAERWEFPKNFLVTRNGKTTMARFNSLFGVCSLCGGSRSRH